MAFAPNVADLATQDPAWGIVVMAHGGDADWNRRIEEVVASVSADVPIQIAFGMADRASLAAAVASLAAAVSALEAEGIRRIAVVRLFVSGESFLPQTEYLLGLDPEVPPFLFDSAAGGGHHHPVADPAAVEPIEHGSAVARSAAGLVDDPFSGRILAERALALSELPADETVLVIAHGMGDEDSNARLLRRSRRAPRRSALLPHDGIAEWIVDTAARMACAEGWVTTAC